MLEEINIKDNSQILQEILDELVDHNADILSALVVSDDGLKVASGIPHQDDDISALTASNLIDMAEDFSRRLEQGKLKRILLEGQQRTTIVIRASKHTVLFVSVPAHAKLGLIILSMRRAVEQINHLFG